MKSNEIINVILENINAAQAEEILHEEIYENKTVTGKHEFLFFIKPEITLYDENIRIDLILDMLMKKLSAFHLSVRNIYALSAAYLDKYNIIARHYGVINAMSRKPLEYFTAEAKEKFLQVFNLKPEEAKIMGSIEFIQQFPDYTPAEIEELWKMHPAVKLSGGTYCAEVQKNNQTIYLINGFHPMQLIHFTEKGRSIVAFNLTGDVDWGEARNKFIGKTNPADAMEGSLRNELLVNQALYGLSKVSSSRNGFHLSAGPVEALAELMRYCSNYHEKKIKGPGDFVFGKQLLNNFSPEEIEFICDNHALIYQGKKTSTFDLTEEKNNDQAIILLKKGSFQT